MIPERRIQIHEWYKKYLSPKFTKFTWQITPEGYKNTYWMEVVLLPDPLAGDTLLETLQNNLRYNMISNERGKRVGGKPKIGIELRDAFIQYMRESGIETRPCFPPLIGGIEKGLDKQIVYDYKWRVVGGEANSQRIWENGIILPSGGSNLTEDAVKHICQVANAFIEESKKQRSKGCR